MSIVVGAREGNYDGAPEARSYELRLPAMFPPVSVKADGVELPYSRFGGKNCWTYDAYSLSPVIHISGKDCSEALSVEMEFDDRSMGRQPELYGVRGVFRRCIDLTVEFKFEQGKKDGYLMLPVEYLKVSQCPNFILENPASIMSYLDSYVVNKKLLFEKIDSMSLIGEGFKQRLRSQLEIRD